MSASKSKKKPAKRLTAKQKEKKRRNQDTTTVPIEKILDVLCDTYPVHPMDELTKQNPYKVLMACILSLRTKDEVTLPASERLFEKANTPEKMVTLSKSDIETLIYPVGFYKTKAQTLLDISQRLIDEFDGVVPDTIDRLLAFKGVGRKTANLVVALGYQKPAICVDTHVHRINNRFGYIDTSNPDETEDVLREKLPLPYWFIVNQVLVLHGQQICKPIGARCDVCPVEDWCEKVDVKARKVSS